MPPFVSRELLVHWPYGQAGTAALLSTSLNRGLPNSACGSPSPLCPRCIYSSSLGGPQCSWRTDTNRPMYMRKHIWTCDGVLQLILLALQHGFRQVVQLSGTWITPSQLDTATRLWRRICSNLPSFHCNRTKTSSALYWWIGSCNTSTRSLAAVQWQPPVSSATLCTDNPPRGPDRHQNAHGWPFSPAVDFFSCLVHSLILLGVFTALLVHAPPSQSSSSSPSPPTTTTNQP